MFEETIRALQKIDVQTTISVPVTDDVDGYFDTECPSEECLFQFKVHGDEWKTKVRGEEVFFHNCGHTAEAQIWWTKEQPEHAKEAALAKVKSSISRDLRRDASQRNRRQSRSGFVSLTVKVDNRPGQVPLPPAAAESMRLKIACPACACRFAVIGAAFFCPACGHNAADQQFTQTTKGIRRSLQALDTVRTAIPDRDTAENTVRLIVESGPQNAVTAFQWCVEALFPGLPSAQRARRKAFQNLAEIDLLWQAATRKTCSRHLTAARLTDLQRAFQQRHLLVHTQSLVDQDYITKSGDTRYKAGQRTAVRADTVWEALALIEKLNAGLQADASGAGRRSGAGP